MFSCYWQCPCLSLAKLEIKIIDIVANLYKKTVVWPCILLLFVLWLERKKFLC